MIDWFKLSFLTTMKPSKSMQRQESHKMKIQSIMDEIGVTILMVPVE